MVKISNIINWPNVLIEIIILYWGFNFNLVIGYNLNAVHLSVYLAWDSEKHYRVILIFFF